MTYAHPYPEQAHEDVTYHQLYDTAHHKPGNDYRRHRRAELKHNSCTVVSLVYPYLRNIRLGQRQWPN